MADLHFQIDEQLRSDLEDYIFKYNKTAPKNEKLSMRIFTEQAIKEKLEKLKSSN